MTQDKQLSVLDEMILVRTGSWPYLLSPATLETWIRGVKILEMKASVRDRLPFCPDHRDKVAGLPCRECEIERLRYVNAVLKEACNAAEMMYAELFRGYAHAATTGGDKIITDAIHKIQKATSQEQ